MTDKQMPKYRVAAQFIISEIETGRYASGERLPTEEHFIKLFNVSRITVRQALNLLEQNGYIQKRQGKGTFVLERKTSMQLNTLLGFSEEMRRKGHVPSTILKSCTLITADEALASKLHVNAGTQVYCAMRVRLADGVPMCIERLHVPFYLCPGLEKENLAASVYEVFLKKYGIKLSYADQNFEAGSIDAAAAVMLGVEPGAPALFIGRVSCLQDGTPVEYVASVYRGDRYKLHVRIGTAL